MVAAAAFLRFTAAEGLACVQRISCAGAPLLGSLARCLHLERPPQAAPVRGGEAASCGVRALFQARLRLGQAGAAARVPSGHSSSRLAVPQPARLCCRKRLQRWGLPIKLLGLGRHCPPRASMEAGRRLRELMPF